MWKTCAVVIAMLVVPVAGESASPAAAGETSLVALLMQTLGVTQTQAEGGAGAIFNLAESKLGPEDFGTVAAAVPEMDTLKQAAPERVEASGMLGGLSQAFGGEGGTVEGLASLAGSFSQLGLDAGMVDQFVPVILDYVEANGGTAVKNLLQSALL